MVTVSASGTYYGPDQTFQSPGFAIVSPVSTGSSVPDIDGAQFSTLGNPIMNNQDFMAFSSTVSGGGVTTSSNAGIWACDTTGALHLVAQSGTVPPGCLVSSVVPASALESGPVHLTAAPKVETNPLFGTFSDPVYNNNEQIAFQAGLVTGSGLSSSNNSGIWSTTSGALSMVARLGIKAQGFPDGVTFASFTGLALPDQGGILLLGTVTHSSTGHITSSNNTGLWEGNSTDDLQLIAHTGEVINGKTVTAIAPLPTSLAQTRSFGQASASLAYTITFNDKTSAEVVIVGDSLQVVAKTKDGAAGTTGQFSTFGAPALNAHNQTAFAATLFANNGITSAHTRGIWADSPANGRQLIANAATAAPGTSGVFSTLNDPVFNDSDAVAFMGTLKVATGQATTTTATGIWSTDGGSLHLAVRQGSQAPGCPSGATFKTLSQFALPDEGGVVFLATLNTSTTTGVTTANAQGVWAVDTGGNLNLIVRAGDTYNGKTISSINFLPTETLVGGQTRGFDQPSGDLAFKVTFTDNSTTLCEVNFP